MHIVKGSGNRNDESEDFCSLVKRGPQGRFKNMKFQKKFNKIFHTKKVNIYNDYHIPNRGIPKIS